MQISWQAQRISHSHPLTLPLADSHLLSLTLALTFISRLSAYRPHIHCLGSLAGIIFVFSSWVVFFCIFKNFVLSKNTTMSYFLHFLISLVFVFLFFLYFRKCKKRGRIFLYFQKCKLSASNCEPAKTTGKFFRQQAKRGGYPTTTRGCSKKQEDQLPIPPISMHIKWQFA